MADLLPALAPLASRVRQDVTWRKVGISTRCDKKIPLSIPVLKRHLRGIEMRGVCPILEGENTTRVAVLDLDSHKGETSWEEMIFVCAKVCDKFVEAGFTPIPFRSSGGKGIHLYFVWDIPQDAYSVRRFMASHLKDLGFNDGTKGVARQEIEIFPKQDMVPKGGFGNQFILPLAGLSTPLEPLFGYEPQEREAALNIVWTPCPDVPFIEKPKIERVKKPIDTENLSPELRRMLEAIPNEETNYDLWIKIGMVLHAETGGSTDGLALWEEWSARCPEYSGYEKLEYKWNSFRDDKDKIVGLGSLKKIAGEHGWQEDYSVDFEEVVDEPAESTPEEPKQKRRRFQPIPVSKFATRKPPQWLIKGLLPKSSTSMTYGGSGDGKTFIILDMALAIARGMDWLGRKVKQGRVVYICAEGSGGFTSRIKAYAYHNHIKLADLDFMTVIPGSPNFMQKKDVEELIQEINDFNERTDLIIIDTMAQTTTGADENSAKDMNIALKYLEALRAGTNSAVHLIHHAGKDEDRGARGSTTLKAALDVQYQVSREGENRLFWVRKMKDGIDGFGYNFRLAPEQIGEDEDGEMQTSCYVEFEEKMIDHRPVGKKRRHTELENLLLDTWDALGGGTIAVNDLVAQAMNSLPHVDGARDGRPKVLNDALLELLYAGDIVVKDGQIVTSLDQV